MAQDDSRRQRAKKDSKRATLPIDRILRNPFLGKTGDVKLKIAKTPKRAVFRGSNYSKESYRDAFLITVLISRHHL
jgi:hypothetical protein